MNYIGKSLNFLLNNKRIIINSRWEILAANWLLINLVSEALITSTFWFSLLVLAIGELLDCVGTEFNVVGDPSLVP